MDLNPSKKMLVGNDSILLGQDTHFVLQSAFGSANPALSADKVGGPPRCHGQLHPFGPPLKGPGQEAR
jgi:hypothetical protein